MSTTQTASGGIGFGGLLTLIFVAAKLWDKIDWPWVWVCAPLWIPVAIGLAFMAILFVIASVVYTVAWVVDRPRPRKGNGRGR